MHEGLVDSEAKLWVPGIPLTDYYPVPTPEELVSHWAETHGHEDVVEAPGVFGAVRVPDSEQRIVASIDLCEVVRDSHLSLAQVVGKDYADITNFHNYAETVGLSVGQETEVLQVLFAAGLVQPVKGIELIAEQIQRWQQQGVYCVANTSTLPGCETATVSFLDEYLPGCFDGILLPRNHDGKGKVTKGDALKSLIVEYFASNDAFTIHIDDAAHHCRDVVKHVGSVLGDNNVITIMPVYTGCVPPPETAIHASDPVEAFNIADQAIQTRV